jgi:hypothetical protein
MLSICSVRYFLARREVHIMIPFNKNTATPGDAAFAALRKQQRAACNAMQPGATPCNLTQPNHVAGKTNPPPDRPPPSPRKLSPITQFVLESAAMEACNAMQPDATPRNLMQPTSRIEKTNPPPPIVESQHAGRLLTPRQLAAARLTAAGHALPDVAEKLQLNRTTVWRWTRDPTFQAELRRLHERWSTPPARTAATRPRGPDPLARYLQSME